jgi:hypothetical protein
MSRRGQSLRGDGQGRRCLVAFAVRAETRPVEKDARGKKSSGRRRFNARTRRVARAAPGPIRIPRPRIGKSNPLIDVRGSVQPSVPFLPHTRIIFVRGNNGRTGMSPSTCDVRIRSWLASSSAIYCFFARCFQYSADASSSFDTCGRSR